MTRIFNAFRLLALLFLFFVFIEKDCAAQIVLLGDNAPHANVNDGDFELVKANWRQSKQSPFWKTYNVEGLGEYKMGIHQGTMFSINDVGIAESLVLNTNPDYQTLQVGDVFNWSFGADLEYISNGTVTLSLIFGDKERILAEKVQLIGSDKVMEHFSGTYSLSQEDVAEGFPFVRATFYSEDEIKVFLDYVNISVENERFKGPELSSVKSKNGVVLNWNDSQAKKQSRFNVYRQSNDKKPFEKLGETTDSKFLDSTLITGVEYTYVVTRFDEREWGASNKVKMAVIDHVAPAPPNRVKAETYDAEVKVSWAKSEDRDVESYSIIRDNGINEMEIAHRLTQNFYVDFTPLKDVQNTYYVVAHDYSGNVSERSHPIKAKVRMVKGASFADLILPMPINGELTSNTWGAEGVVPRDVENGIEDPEWSYWGGRPVADKDGKYHMNVTRWPANSTKGHWEWPRSTVAYTVADQPTGPYKVVRDVVYNFADGLGHNPDIILLNNGTYLMYSLINWEATLFKSKSMKGPWKRLGVMKVNEETTLEDPARFYRFYRNLSGVQREDGRFLFVTKGGAMMLSEGKDPLGPYTVLTKPIQGNPIIPEKYRNSNYEDPVLWKDDVQYHMMINAFWDYRAIYLRSPDGINWKFNPGTSYSPNNTKYADGTQTHWKKLERPHVLTDEYGRATHLSLAAIDVYKADDLARDNHNSKNLILPLVVPKRLKLLNKECIDEHTPVIRVLIHSEDGFEAQEDIDFESLRFGAPEEVDYGGGYKAGATMNRGKNIIVEFEGDHNGITKNNFVGKLLGKTTSGELIIGYTRLCRE